MAIIIFLVLLSIAIIGQMNQKRKELERRIEKLEKLNGIEHYPLDAVAPVDKDEQ